MRSPLVPLLVASLCAASLAAGVAAADPASPLPPWRDADDLPIPASVRSAVVLKGDLPVVREPRADAPRRGSAALDARLPVFGAKRGPGCTGRFLLVGPAAWVCQDGVDLTPLVPLEADDDRFLAARGGFPFRYFFVGKEGSNGYRNLREADDVAPDLQLQPGFALAIVEEQPKGPEKYGKTHHGLWVPMRDLGEVRAIPFHGEELAPGEPLDFGWVVEDRVPVFSRPEAGARAKQTHARFDRVPLGEVKKSGRVAFVKSGETWLRESDVRRPQKVAPPPEVRAGERWIDIELASQTLVAYEGTEPVFATLVSTGKGAQGTELATPKGTHRVWVKLRSSNMDNLEDEDAERWYAIEDVPWVQYFSKGVGLHAAFWHRDFGHPRSHGCVNLAPLDAQRLFGFTGPPLPAGWTATLPSPVEPGTVVRVR